MDAKGIVCVGGRGGGTRAQPTFQGRRGVRVALMRARCSARLIISARLSEAARPIGHLGSLGERCPIDVPAFPDFHDSAERVSRLIYHAPVRSSRGEPCSTEIAGIRRLIRDHRGYREMRAALSDRAIAPCALDDSLTRREDGRVPPTRRRHVLSCKLHLAFTYRLHASPAC